MQRVFAGRPGWINRTLEFIRQGETVTFRVRKDRNIDYAMSSIRISARRQGIDIRTHKVSLYRAEVTPVSENYSLNRKSMSDTNRVTNLDFLLEMANLIDDTELVLGQ